MAAVNKRTINVATDDVAAMTFTREPWRLQNACLPCELNPQGCPFRSQSRQMSVMLGTDQVKVVSPNAMTLLALSANNTAGLIS